MPGFLPRSGQRPRRASLSSWAAPPDLPVPRIMHDEVSETENIRKNLAIERMIIEGCEILLDTSQTFVRQGTASAPAPQVGPAGWPGSRASKPAGVTAACSRAAGGVTASAAGA